MKMKVLTMWCACVFCFGAAGVSHAVSIGLSLDDWTDDYAANFYGSQHIGNGGSIAETASGLNFTGTGFRQGNALATTSTFDLRDTTVYLKWQASGAGTYMQINVGVASVDGTETLSPHLATPGGWNRYAIVSPETWYFTRLTLGPNGSFETVTALNGYDDGGGTVFNDPNSLFPCNYSGTLAEATFDALADGRILLGLADNYGGTSAWLTIGEAIIDDNPETTPVPEPGTVLLLATGIAGLVAAKRRKRG